MKTTPVIAASLCGIASSLAAEPAVRSLSEIVVKAKKDKSLTSPTVETARKELEKVPGGTEVIDADRYLRGRTSTVADTFALSPGVFAQSRFGSDEARLSIRGSGIQRTYHGRSIRIMQDGLPLNLADGSFDMQAIEPTAASYVEVWRGANALDRGSSMLGGAIDYISRTGLNSPGVDARVEAGSYGYLRTGLAGGLTAGSADLYASATYQEQGGFRDHARQENERLFSNIGWRINDDVETRFYLSAFNTNSELPGNLTKTELETDPRKADPGSVALDQHRNFAELRLANKTTVRDGDTTWEFIAGVSHKDLDHPIFQVLDQNSNDFIVGLTGTYDGEIAGHANRLRGGVNFTYGDIDYSAYTNIAGHRGSLVSNADQTAQNVEGFLEDQFTIGSGFTLVAGTTAAYNRRQNEMRFGPGADYANDYANISPKLGFRWDGPSSVQVYGNISRSYEPPSFGEAIAAALTNKAQTGTTLELGTRGTYASVRWDASVYHAAIRDELLALDHDNNPLTPALTVNADKTTHSGVELGFEGDVLGTPWDQTPDNRLVFRSAWTYGDFRFDHDARYGDNQLPGLPSHLIRGELTWENHAGWYAGPTFEWVPVKTFIDERNSFAADPYAICGFKFGRRVETGMSWFVELRNLTDKKYATSTGVIEDAHGTDQRQFLPGDGRSLYGGVEWKW